MFATGAGFTCSGDINILSGDIVMSGSNTITGLADPVNDQQVATKAYADSVGGGGGSKLPLIGGTMSGPIANLRTSDVSVVLGSGAGLGSGSVSVGENAGQTSMGTNSVAIGRNAGKTSMSDSSVSIGRNAGETGMNFLSVAIGDFAGASLMSEESVAVGQSAGRFSMAAGSVAIGTNAAKSACGPSVVAIGEAAASVGSATRSVTLGALAGEITAPKHSCISIGQSANRTSGGGIRSIAIGAEAATFVGGNTPLTIGDRSISIGDQAGSAGVGASSVVIGALAGTGTAVHANSILVNANGVVGASSGGSDEIKLIAGSTSFVADSTSARYNTLPLATTSDLNSRLSTSGGTVTGDVAFTSSTPTLNPTSGAVVISGGLGVGQGLKLAGQLQGTSTAISTSTSTGAFVTAGGIGVGADSFFGGQVDLGGNRITNVGAPSAASSHAATALYAETVATNAASGKLSLTGGSVSGNVTFTSATASTGPTSGAIVVSGGVGVGGDLNVQGATQVSGLSKFILGVDSTATNNGSVVVVGGVGVSGGITLGGKLTSTSTTVSTSTSTGSFVTLGGIGVAAASFFGGEINLGANRIVNLGAPTAGSAHASTALYAETVAANAASGKLNLTGGTITGTLTMGATSTLTAASGATLSAGGNRWTNIGAPTAGSTNAATALYAETVASNVGALKLSLTGGTMTGSIDNLRTTDISVILGSGANAGSSSVSIGQNAGNSGQGSAALALGPDSGSSNQGNFGVALGSASGSVSQGVAAVAIGEGSGKLNQSTFAVAVGKGAGSTGQGQSAVAIGQLAGETSQHTNSVLINANSNVALNSSSSNQIKIVAGTTSIEADSSGFRVPNATDSTSTTTGAITTPGGAGIGQSVFIGGSLNVSGSLTVNTFRFGPLFSMTAAGTTFSNFTNAPPQTLTSATGQGSSTLPANLLTAGSLVLFRFAGTVGALNNNILTLNLLFGSTAMVSPATTMTAVTNRIWQLEVWMTVRAAGGAGTASAFSHAIFMCTGASAATCLMGPTGAVAPTQPLSTGWATNVSNVVTLTATWNAASASNTVSCQHFSIFKVA